jgi:hypothetical protein
MLKELIDRAAAPNDGDDSQHRLQNWQLAMPSGQSRLIMGPMRTATSSDLVDGRVLAELHALRSQVATLQQLVLQRELPVRQPRPVAPRRPRWSRWQH